MMFAETYFVKLTTKGFEGATVINDNVQWW
jgi:hypothetical protein